MAEEGGIKGVDTDGALILAEFCPRYGLHPYRLKATGNFTKHQNGNVIDKTKKFWRKWQQINIDNTTYEKNLI